MGDAEQPPAQQQQQQQQQQPAKRQRMSEEDAPPPSAVLHVRNMPLDVSELELRALFPNQAAVYKLLVLKTKGQGFVQFTDVDSAAYALQFFETQRAQIRNKQVYLQYSRRNELDNVPPASTLAAMAPMGSMPGAMGTMGGGMGAPMSLMPGFNQHALVTPGSAPSRPGCVLHVTISDCFYPLTVDLLHTVFQTCGTVLKMLIMNKVEVSGTTQVLVQYANEPMAENARISLHGKYLFDGAGLLKIQMSKFETLKILYNNEKSRDYTQNLPFGPMGQPMMPTPTAYAAQGMFHPGYMMAGPAAMASPMAYADPMVAAAAAAAAGNGSPVVLANKLNEERITCDALFNLFGVYGDVQRVKILYNKRHTAMIQLSNAQQAQLAVRMLNNIALFGKPMSLTISSHSSVKMPNPESEEAQNRNTVSYEKSEFHRFTHPGSKNYANIFPPSMNLHLSNVADGATEQQLRDLFAPYGTVTGFRFFPNSNKMAVVTMDSIGSAVDALVSLHQFPLQQDQRLRISFAKTGKTA